MSGWRAPSSQDQAPIEKAASKGGRLSTLAAGPRSRNGQERARKGCVEQGSVQQSKEVLMRSVLLYLIGIPIPIILLLALCTHHF
jgi:hypothetical protein